MTQDTDPPGVAGPLDVPIRSAGELRGWTRHGHRIEGVAQVGARPIVRRCGNVTLCRVCQLDARTARAAAGVHDADERLVELLRTAGDEWGPLGVALVAAQLTDPAAVVARLAGPQGEPRPEGGAAADWDARGVHPAGMSPHPFRPDTHGRAHRCNTCLGADPDSAAAFAGEREELAAHLASLPPDRRVLVVPGGTATDVELARAHIVMDGSGRAYERERDDRGNPGRYWWTTGDERMEPDLDSAAAPLTVLVERAEDGTLVLAGVPYDRERLVDVLVRHAQTSTSGCLCGGVALGGSYPEHVAAVYEAGARP